MDGKLKNEATVPVSESAPARARHIYLCDRCGCEMHEKNCKIVCSNCGNRFDCSDLNLYLD
jgi:hypothetical protein